MKKHEFTIEGSDSGFPRCCAVCACGWSGDAIDGQGPAAKEQAKADWTWHMKNRHIKSDYQLKLEKFEELRQKRLKENQA